MTPLLSIADLAWVYPCGVICCAILAGLLSRA